jgi:hypothetical protein
MKYFTRPTLHDIGRPKSTEVDRGRPRSTEVVFRPAVLPWRNLTRPTSLDRSQPRSTEVDRSRPKATEVDRGRTESYVFDGTHPNSTERQSDSHYSPRMNSYLVEFNGSFELTYRDEEI